MVLESVVVELMNKFLGDYIENLNSSQLKLSIWSGDVVLENLHVKGDALKDLDLPVQIKFGHVGKLTLKIPWKNLYKEAVEATLDGLYLLAVPNEEVAYDAEKEEKREQDAKQAQLAAIEEQQLKNRKGPPDPKQDSFVEKLATQVVKNLQVHIQNIHVRYEDKVTIKDHPFAFGVTLHKLSLQTTNENWIPCLLDESVKIIYKMIDLQCLSVYWNPDPKKFLSGSARDVQLNYFKDTIATQTQVPQDFNYIVQPITLQVQFRLNPHPENELSIPKIVLSVSLQTIGLRMLRVQYHSVMELVESMDRMAVNAPFRKFKPQMSILERPALWWKYAYNSLLSTGVIVKAGQWSWSTIKKHRLKIKDYKRTYKEKLLQKKPSQKLTDQLLSMEQDLDVFNITLVRQTAEMELVKAGKQIKSKESVHQLDKQPSKSESWFGGWFGKKKEPEKTEEVKKEGLDAVMSAQEKEDFYLAIGYSEAEKVADMSGFEKSYVGLKLSVELKKVSVELSDNSVSEKDLLSLNLLNVCSVVEQRPSADGLKVTAGIGAMRVDGMHQGDIVPCVISSDILPEHADKTESAKQNLLSFLFEMNPLDGACDQRIAVDSQPLQIVYDAQTVNSLLEFVKPPESVRLQQLRAVAASAYDDIKEQTATGLKHAMDTKSVVEIAIRLSSSYVVVPKTGFYSKGVECLVLDLGEFSLRSDNDGRTPMMKKPKVDRYSWMKEPEQDDSLILEEMREKVYDNFDIELRKIQLLHAHEGQNWMASRGLNESPMHILQPLSIAVTLQKCMIINDAALPKVKISGEIPSLQLRISDMKLRNILGLVESIPLPVVATEEEKKVELAVVESWTKDNDRSYLKVLNSTLVANTNLSTDSVVSADKHSSATGTTTDEEFFSAESELGSESDFDSPARTLPSSSTKQHPGTQMTDIKLSFAIKEMITSVVEESESGESTDLLTLRIGTLGVKLLGRTWDTTVDAYLQSISVHLMQFSTPDGKPLYLVDSVGSGGSEHLLKVKFIQAKTDSPEFESVHNKTAQKIIVRFGTLRLALHAPALLHLAKFGQKLAAMQPQKSELPTRASLEVPESGADSRSRSSTVTKAKPSAPSQIVDLHVDAQLDSIEIAVMDQSSVVTNLKIRDAAAGVFITSSYLKVDAKLRGLSVQDAARDVLYKDIISSVGQGDVLVLELVNYIDATSGQEAFENMKNVDTSVKVRFGSTRIVFLNKFIQGLIDYARHFSEFQEAAVTAGTSAQKKAAGKAQELAQSLQTSNPRIQLDVSVTAPTVVVPTNSKSRDVLVADLGTVTVANRFSGSSFERGFAVSDEMVVSLRNMTILKTTLTKDLELGDETRILEEVTLSVQIIRNLSTSWYHDIPDVSIHGRLPPISVKLSQSDFKAVMSVLDENLKEGKKTEEVAEKEPDKAIVKAGEKKVVSKQVKKQATKPPSQVWETLKVDFQIDDVKLELFVDANRTQALSKLELMRLTSEVTMKNDESLDVDFAFGELALEDTRAVSAGGITKLIRNKTGAKNESLVSAKIVQKADGSLEVDASVSSISIIISVEFLLKLATFFTEALPLPPPSEAAVKIAEEAAGKLEPSTPQEEKPEEPAEKAKAIRVTFKLEEPEIVLVTNVTSLDGEAITLGMVMELNYDLDPDVPKQIIIAKISNLHIDTCAFKHVLNNAPYSSLTHKKVLSPCQVAFAGFIADAKQDFTVTISDIIMKASPVLIQTISDVVAQLSPPPDEVKDVETKKMREPLAVWDIKKISDMNLWYMKESVVESLVDRLEETDGPAVVKKEERARVEIKMIQITLESGAGHHTVPLLIAELSVEGNVSDWSSGELRGEVNLTLGAAYFNDFLSVWEPLIEPNEVDPTALEPKYEPWRLQANLQQRKPTAQDDESADLPPLMSLNVKSKQILYTTVSSAALKVIQELGIAFKDAALSKEFGTKQLKRRSRKSGSVEAADAEAAVVVSNQLGCEIAVDLGKSFRLVIDLEKTASGYPLPNKQFLLLDYQETGHSDLNSILRSQARKLSSDTDYIYIRWEAGDVCCVDVSRARSTLHVLKCGNKSLHFVAEIRSFAGIRNVVLRSHVLLHNKLDIDIQVLKINSGDAGQDLGILPSKGRFPVPPQLVNGHAVQLKAALKTQANELNTCTLSWKEAIETTKSGFYSENYLKFAPVKASGKPVNFCVEFVEEKLVHAGDVKDFSQPGLNIYIRPTIVFSNFLPFSVRLASQSSGYSGEYQTVESGSEIQVLDAAVTNSKFKVNVNYRGVIWNSTYEHSANELELSPWIFTDPNDSEKSITLAKQIQQSDGVLSVTLYSPYWMVNKTGFPLDYKMSGADESTAVQQPRDGQDIVLFSFPSKSFRSKNKLQLRVCNSSFSDGFSLDVVGSSGTITCKTKDFDYMIGMHNHLTSFRLTKIITFTSYYSFHNKSDLDVEISECNDIWQAIDAGKKIDIWPEQSDRFLVTRLKGVVDSVSAKFRYNQLDSGVLIRLKDYALFVEVSVTEMSVEVSVRNYFDGATAVLIVNDTSQLSLQCWQGSSATRQTIEAGEAYHLVWSEPTDKREVTWSSPGGKETSFDVFKDQSSTLILNDSGKLTKENFVRSLSKRQKSATKIHVVLFGDGLQRVLLFTKDFDRARVVEAQIRLERANLEVELSLQGLACSLADSASKREVAFVAITSSGLIWEEKPNKRWKPLAVKYSQILETSYQKQQKGSPANESLSLDTYKFNLKSMKVIAPQERPLQRSFTPGLWFQLRSTSNQMTIHAKINRLQIDNQLPGAVFPVVFYPVPLPKSIAVDSSPKPFLEVSLMQKQIEQQSFMLIKYFKVLVQEFAVKLDMGFITGLLPVFGAEQLELTAEQKLKYFQYDLSLSNREEEIETSSSSVNFFDMLHLSPIKVHISFSMQNSLAGSNSNNEGAASVVKLPFNALTVVFQSVGITLSDIDDVVFKLAFFERKYQFFSSAQFANAVVYHYAGQAIKQLYVLVFGLDVIGNPYGLVMGIAGGVTDLFYEPYQGIMQGPGEFFEGLGLGALSLLGNTVGGAAGAVSKVTGALGKGVASITMDDEYKRKRLEEKNKQPADLKEGLARGGKGLVMGVFSGITGVVTKPIEGAKQEGAAGFFKGVGKGLIGVVARPVSGVIDLASNTFEGIQKVADMSEEVRKIRPARWIDQHTGIIQPYSLKRAQGAAILEEIEQGKFVETNRYIDHVPLKPNRKSILMLTNKMVLTAHTGDILGHWKCDWKCVYGEIIGNLELTGNILTISYKMPDPAQTGLFGTNTSNAGNVLPALTRGLTLGNLKTNTMSIFSRRSLFTRSNTTAAANPTVKFSSDKTSVRIGQRTKEEEQDQNKTRSFFGGRTGQETMTFDDPKCAEYIFKKINHYRRKAQKGSFSSIDSPDSSCTE